MAEYHYRDQLKAINGYLNAGIFRGDQLIDGDEEIQAVYEVLKDGVLREFRFGQHTDFPESALIEASEGLILVDYDVSSETVLLMLLKHDGDYDGGRYLLKSVKEQLISTN